MLYFVVLQEATSVVFCCFTRGYQCCILLFYKRLPVLYFVVLQEATSVVFCCFTRGYQCCILLFYKRLPVLYFVYFCTLPEPQFEETLYTVPENDRTVPLCINMSVEITESLTYTITAVQKDPPEAEGEYKHCVCKLYLSLIISSVRCVLVVSGVCWWYQCVSVKCVGGISVSVKCVSGIIDQLFTAMCGTYCVCWWYQCVSEVCWWYQCVSEVCW